MLLNTDSYIGTVSTIYRTNKHLYVTFEGRPPLPMRWQYGWDGQETAPDLFLVDDCIFLSDDDWTVIQQGDTVLVQFGDGVTPNPFWLSRGVSDTLLLDTVPYVTALKRGVDSSGTMTPSAEVQRILAEARLLGH